MNSSQQEAAGGEAKYEEQFCAFLDLLGFSEASAKVNDDTRMRVLALLRAFASLQSEFSITTDVQPGTMTQTFKPAVSTFSDNIVISYPTGRLDLLFILGPFSTLVARVAAAALRIGFPVRGGATIGMLYHANGVVFGEAMIEAWQLERQTAVYPRVVVSQKLKQRWSANPLSMGQAWPLTKDCDGIFHVDYLSQIVLGSSCPDDQQGVKSWLEEVVPIIDRNLKQFESAGELNKLAKWTWFAKKFKTSLLVEGQNSQLLKKLNIAPPLIPW